VRLSEAAEPNAIRLPVHGPWQLQVGDEVLDVCGLDVRQRTIAEPIDQRLQSVVDRRADRQPLRQHMTLLVDVRKLAERCRCDLARPIESAFVERSVANGAAQVVQRCRRRSLAVDLTVRPLGQADAHAAEAASTSMLDRSWLVR
jgi:hypothetical protein